MNCITWNIRGLECPDRKYVVRNFISGMKNLDLIMLQEVKATGFCLESNLNFIWKDAVKFHTNHPHGRGGVVILLSPKWGPRIKCHGISPCNRALWLILEINNRQFGICAIYASNDYSERASFWSWLSLLPDIPWVFGGDFNMIENQEDKMGGLPFSWKDQERKTWYNFKISKSLFDPLSGNRNSNSGLWFTWCNFQKGQARIYSRLDRFYLSSNFFSVLPNEHNRIVNIFPSTLSDHHPISISISLGSFQARNKQDYHKFLLNTNLLKDEDILAAISIIRLINNSQYPSLSHIDRWKMNVAAWQKLLMTVGQKKAKDFRSTESRLNSNLYSAEMDIQNKVDDPHLCLKLANAKHALRKHQQLKTMGAKIRSRAHWLQFGDRGSKFFFNLIKQKHAKENIDHLLINNEMNTNVDSIKNEFSHFYANLFTSEDSQEANILRNQCRGLIPNRISNNDASLLEQPLTIEEIELSINSFKNDKAPGPDGLPAEFYKANSKWICNALVDLYNEAIDIGTLGRNINSGIIKLIPKEGDKSLIKNWRPITLLNLSYKILAKVMARRLEKILPKFICHSQTGFVKGRFILENLITSWEALNWANITNQDAAMFLLDFEKAYDRIEWNFIIMMLDAFGFPPFFCNVVKMLLKDAYAQVDVNGSLSAPFPLGRSIRQGCPLAPALFVISSEALYYILRDSTLSPIVKGITLPDNNELINCQFADDTAIFFEASESNFDAMISKLNFFCKISGARLSQSKSICLGWNTHPPIWFEKFGFQWGGPSKIVKYLGIPFSVDPSLKEMWRWVKDKILNKLNKWHNRSLSLAGRIQVCQKILSSYNIYYASAWMFNDYQVLEIQKAIRNYLWSDGKGNKKTHSVNWTWCHTDKLLGGLGLKDLKLSGIALASKWIFHALEGEEPWKVLIRNNIGRGYPKKAKFWKNLPLADLICGEFPTIVQGSTIFKSIWKAWDYVRQLITNKEFFGKNTLHGERSIWWNLKLGNKPLALTQGCSAKIWANNGIKQFVDIFEKDSLIKWEELKAKFNLPDVHKRTYNMIAKASKNIPTICYVDSDNYQKIKWPSGIALLNIKAKDIYKVINHNEDILSHINKIWYTDLDKHAWMKKFDYLWKSSIDPKIKCFKWLLILNKLPIRNSFSTVDFCNICRVPETGRHILFECTFAKEIWLMFGISIPTSFTIFEVITGFICNAKNDVNIFWNILSANILWQIWKCRNEERFQNKPRLLTESFQSLTYFKIFSQVQITMRTNKSKFKRLLKDGYATFFANELKDGHIWRQHLDNVKLFNQTIQAIRKEIKRTPQSFTSDMIYMRKQIQDKKNLVWMEGNLGWTTWMDTYVDVLH
jgi:hypothetical protein